MKYAIFGDVHGNANALAKLFSFVKSRCSDVVFYTLGDIIDRGPDSKTCLELCADHNVQGVYGNHELWLSGVLGGLPVDEMAYDAIMGGKATLKSFGISLDVDGDVAGEQLRQRLTPAVQEFLQRLSLFVVLPAGDRKLYLTHSGVNSFIVQKITADAVPDIVLLNAIAKAMPNQVLWTTPDVREWNGGLYRFQEGMQVFGHLPMKKPKVTDYYVALDTGSGTCAPHALSLLLVDSATGEMETHMF